MSGELPQTNASNSNALATVGWVNDATRSTNVVHRSGNETIGGTKSFTSSIRIVLPDRTGSYRDLEIIDPNGNRVGSFRGDATSDGRGRISIAPVNASNGRLGGITITDDGAGGVTCSVPALPTTATGARIATCDFVLSKVSGVSDPVGTIKIWPSSTLPAGYLWCDGSSVSKNNYGALYNAIGTAFGGNGNPNFNLPNLIRCSPWMVADHSVGNGGLGRLPNITATWQAAIDNNGDRLARTIFSWSGAVQGEDVGASSTYRGFSGNGSAVPNRANFSASRSNSIYQDSDRVIPAWLNLNFIIKYT